VSNCEVAAGTARRLDLPASVQAAVAQAFEWWNGRGRPRRLAGDQIALPARLAHVAATASLFHELGGQDAALAAVPAQRRLPRPGDRGGRCPPRPRLLADLGVGDVHAAVVKVEPEPRRLVGEAELDGIASACEDLVDLKSPFLLGDAGGVAEVAAGAARELRLDAATVARSAGPRCCTTSAGRDPKRHLGQAGSADDQRVGTGPICTPTTASESSPARLRSPIPGRGSPGGKVGRLGTQPASEQDDQQRDDASGLDSP
jgi:hypothetical protein